MGQQEVIDYLRDSGEATAAAMKRELPMNDNNLYRQLSKLQDRDIVDKEQEGPFRAARYRLNPDAPLFNNDTDENIGVEA